MAKSTTLSLGRYTADAKAWVVAAQALADERGHVEVSPLHLLVRGLERHRGVAEVFRRSGADPAELAAAAERTLAALPRGQEPAYLASRLLDLLGRLERHADKDGMPQVAIEHVLAALAQEVRGSAGEVLGAFGIGPGSLEPHLAVLRSHASHASHAGGAASFGGPAPDGASSETRDLVREARESEGDPVVGRAAELRRLVTILERREKCHPLLVGEPGVGKGAIVRALARRIARGEVPPRLLGVRLLQVDAGQLVSGARLRAEADQRVRRLALSARGDGDPVLVLGGLEQLFGQGGSVSAAGDAVRSALGQGLFRLLATTTPEGLRRIAERDPTFLRELTVLEVAEPSPDEAVEILRGVVGRFEEHHGVRIGESAALASVTLARRYLSDRFLPESAIDLLDESAAALRVETDGMPSDLDLALRRLESLKAQLAALEGVDDAATSATRLKLSEEVALLEPRAVALRVAFDERRKAGEGAPKAALGEEHVAAMLAAWTGIPVAKMLEGEADKLLRMEERLERRVVGQSEGVRALSRAVRRGRVGLRDPRRPIGSFLFLGPSGVGKTELAKALAEFLFDDEAALTRLDMSEFMERHMAQRLLGAPPGYADSEQGGFLTEAVRRRPYSVLLFDEVEKAHQDVFNLLLQVLDDGRLTDGRGRLADFTNTVVILTSNIGSERILDADAKLFESSEGRDALRDVLMDQLGKFFRPEFLNRIDDVIVFRPLAREHLARIADIQLDKVRALLGPRGIHLEVDPAAKALLVELGYHPALGARPLRRAILKHVQDPLAEKLLERGVAHGATLAVRRDGDALVLEARPPEG